jgi:hypothetical protein
MPARPGARESRWVDLLSPAVESVNVESRREHDMGVAPATDWRAEFEQLRAELQALRERVQQLEESRADSLSRSRLKVTGAATRCKEKRRKVGPPDYRTTTLNERGRRQSTCARIRSPAHPRQCDRRSPQPPSVMINTAMTRR